MGIRQDQCNKVCRIIDDYLANRPRERDELIVAVRTVFKEADRKTEPTSSKMEQVDKEYPRCVINGTPFDECGFCEHFNCDTCKCEAQTERSSE